MEPERPMVLLHLNTQSSFKVLSTNDLKKPKMSLRENCPTSLPMQLHPFSSDSLTPFSSMNPGERK